MGSSEFAHRERGGTILSDYADFANHHIEGYARVVQERGEGSGHFKVPLISEVLPGLWQGGCKDGVELAGFDFVVSLYPWEKYFLVGPCERVEIRAYDSAEVPDVTEAVTLAYDAWKAGKRVLIHCQAGLNRSGLTAAQVLMRDGYTAEEAITLLREKRCDLVLCNKAFEAHLLAMPC